jgi:CRP-like cAMP-binding protein
MLVRHALAVYTQIQQIAGCNASHTVEARLARCLLHTRDLSGSDRLVLTQELMAQMIGARRNSVSLVANTMQQADFIHYSRGHIELKRTVPQPKTITGMDRRAPTAKISRPWISIAP